MKFFRGAFLVDYNDNPRSTMRVGMQGMRELENLRDKILEAEIAPEDLNDETDVVLCDVPVLVFRDYDEAALAARILDIEMNAGKLMNIKIPSMQQEPE